jgi:hypothetical protein
MVKRWFFRMIIVLLIACGSFMVVWGIFQQDPWKVYINAVIICLSCIGIGK